METIKNNDNSNNNINTLWINNPKILFDTNKILNLWPLESMSREEKINSISRLVLFITLFGIFIFRDIKILLTGIITLVILILTYYYLNKNNNLSILNKLKEGFCDETFYNNNKKNYTNPNKDNPIMNVLLPEIQDDPHRKSAAPSYNNAVKQEINESTKDFVKKNFNDDKIDTKLFNDLGDKIQFEQSMRQFYTTPNTQIPNNQKEFAQFCYGNMASCKDGDTEMCLKSSYRHTNM
tara:strand:- start:314 stop:1024 length:711 start_codon:yes stop_codon:yes gene_type:complete